MRYQVVICTKGNERVIREGIRRENGAIAERDIAADSAYRNARKHCEGDPTAHAVRGAVENDPNAEAIVYFDALVTVVTVVTYRRVPPLPEADTLADELLASIIALDNRAYI
jgi:hypothetical protein